MTSRAERKPAAINVLDIGRTPIVDKTNIPLDSDRAPKSLIAGIDWQYQKCPFSNSPSRYPNGQSHPTPMSGLERSRLAENYPPVLAVMDNIRSPSLEVMRFLDPNKGRPLNAGEMRKLLRTLSWLPRYLTQRAVAPINARGSLPPEFIILANSASGSLGALEGSLVPHNENPAVLRTVPNPEHMISTVERLGRLIGDQTVCVASPDQMRHFFRHIIEGAPQYRDRFDISPWIDTSKEIIPMLVYGEHAYLSNLRMEELRGFDGLVYGTLEKELKRGRNIRRYRPEVEDFVKQTTAVLAELSQRQEAINGALGRQTSGPKLTMPLLEKYGLKMPKLTKQFVIKR